MICISVLLAEKMIFFRRVIYNFPVFQLISLRKLLKKTVKGKLDHVRRLVHCRPKIDYTDTVGKVSQKFTLLSMLKNNY